MLTASVKEAPSSVTGVYHTTVIYCLKQVGKNLPGATLCAMPIPQRGRSRWVANFCRCKKTCIGHLTAVDHKKPGLWNWVLPSRLCLGTFAPNWAVVGREMLRILDWWMVSKCWFYCSRRPNCQLDLWDTGGKGKYPVATLSARRVVSHERRLWESKSEKMVRYKGSAVTPLSQILRCPDSSLIHSAIVQHLISFLNSTSKVFTICLW